MKASLTQLSTVKNLGEFNYGDIDEHFQEG